MNRSDRTKALANAPRAKYSGSFLSTFFNHDSMLALGVRMHTPGRLPAARPVVWREPLVATRADRPPPITPRPLRVASRPARGTLGTHLNGWGWSSALAGRGPRRDPGRHGWRRTHIRHARPAPRRHTQGETQCQVSYHKHTRYIDVVLYCCNATRSDVAYGAAGWSQRVFTRWLSKGSNERTSERANVRKIASSLTTAGREGPTLKGRNEL